jgi:hypothetical protein
LAPYAAEKRNALEISVQCVGPLMVRAKQILAISEPLLAKLHPPMRATVLDHRNLVWLAADNDNGAFAQSGCSEVTDIGNFTF